jgi:hypothetical protein
MFESFLTQCGPLQHKKAFDQNSLHQLKDLLPNDLLTLISQGEGSYMNGYLWIIDPPGYQDILEEVYKPVENPSTCFARDAFGGLYVWEGESIVYINVRHGNSKVIGRKISVFFNNIITDWEYLSEVLYLENFYPAKEALGDLSFDECYGYVPLLGLGGSEKVENLQKVKIKEHLSIIAQAVGKID